MNKIFKGIYRMCAKCKTIVVDTDKGDWCPTCQKFVTETVNKEIK
jgi:RNA polymerase subunit RPABC4/transcription elongation factor Spt4